MLHPICDCLTDTVCRPNTVLETDCQEDKNDTVKNSGGEKTGLCTTAVRCLWRYFNLPCVCWLYSSFQFTPGALRNRPTLQPFWPIALSRLDWAYASSGSERFPRYFFHSLEQAQTSLLKRRETCKPPQQQPAVKVTAAKTTRARHTRHEFVRSFCNNHTDTPDTLTPTTQCDRGTNQPVGRQPGYLGTLTLP